MQEVVSGLYRVPLGVVNAYLLVDGAVTVIDTGTPGSEEKILRAIRTLGKEPSDVDAIIVTHLHADHAGSLAALKAATGAEAWMHPADAAPVRDGVAARQVHPAPGLANRLLFTVMRLAAPARVPPAEVEHHAEDGDTLPFAGGLRVHHVPGHSAGQIALVWPRHGGVLVAGDVAMNMALPGQRRKLSHPPIFEDFEAGSRAWSVWRGSRWRWRCSGTVSPSLRVPRRSLRSVSVAKHLPVDGGQLRGRQGPHHPLLPLQIG